MMIRSLFAALFLVAATPAVLAQQAQSPVAVSTKALDDAGAELHAIDVAFNGRTDSAEKQALQARIVAVRQVATAQVATLTPELAQIDALIGQLGTPTPGVVEAPDIRAQRKLLAQQRSAADSGIKRGKLIGVEADQLASEISDSQSDAFSERMSVRVASPLTPGFWLPVFHAMPRDGQRVAFFLSSEIGEIGKGFGTGTFWPALLGLVVAIVMMGPLRLGLRRLGRRVMIERAPGNRLRRSGLALWFAVEGTLIPFFAAGTLVGGFRAADMLASSWEPLASGFVRVSLIAGMITSLGGALLQRRQASWRLLTMSDAGAQGLRPWTFGAAAVVFAGVIVSAFNDAAGVSGPASEAADVFVVILHLLLVTGLLVTIGRLRAKVQAAEEEKGGETASAAGIAFFSLAAWAVVLIGLGALLAGYLSLSLFLLRMLVWVPVVAAALYLALIATDDICTSLFSGESGFGRALHHGFGVRKSLIDQFGVALSALLRILILLIGASFVFRPFGANLGSLFDQASELANGVTIGQITLSPGAILRAISVMAVGLFVVRLVQGWLTNRYLPATELDAGARNSISMVARYAGLILATLWAMASLGIGIERIALLLSALSVGIGFGLQAITQNFVSGLILLAERPVKIGDLVRIGDQEGDVKRISVRATEIQIADRSTLIVPNSELITKTILNKTLADPIGRVQLQFSVPIGTDVVMLRDRVLAIFEGTPSVLDDPKSLVFIDSIADGRINLNCFAYVSSPRAAYPAKSEILFRLLTEMPEAGIELGTTPTQFQFLHAPDGTPPPSPPGSEGPIGS